ncbi:sodium/potassium-transporting ATPase subunit beta-like [Daphnia pulicaria]|uniref:sodium/potassium-transporting ATPase subunit beta-like n=1 Tax=Daphnia pulicaria TaxID=35523 RepID=UPI001EE9F27F|nr:sodium/potassium-transporting ATPase subunit beta-like [Daphnia pulicaria]XP_046641941.1 sodium/potassium-transporting ATPase subunit beta-like [Daphnia pulicaria]
MSNKKTDEPYKRPQTLTRCQEITQFLYNKDTHEVLGRTAKSWFQITVFYIVLYAFLAGFFIALLTVFYQTLNDHEPKWTMGSSLIGNSPGMGYRPTHADPDVTVISFNAKEPKYWSDRVDDFLGPYYTIAPMSDSYAECNYGTASADPVTPCSFKVDLNKCAQNDYGFAVNKPCLFLKPNKIFGWTPIPYTKEEIESEELQMPANLKTAILKLPTDVIEKNIWVSCLEVENFNVTLEYDTHIGFPSYYFPYANQKGYLSPFVAMQVDNLPVGTTVKISCRLWAKNIVVDKQRRLGMTNLEILSNA